MGCWLGASRPFFLHASSLTDSIQAWLDAPETLTRASAIAIASTNIEKLLGLGVDPYEADIVATSGGDLLSFEGKVVAIISPRRGAVDFFA